jgi:hypothetical protein
MTSEDLRYSLARDLDGVVKRLRQVKDALEDRQGESLGLVIARLGEANERLSCVVEDTQEALAAGLVTAGDDEDVA